MKANNLILHKANLIYNEHFGNNACFERAIFLSWYCSKGDCKFCYMSTQKKKITDPKRARRRKESVLAEALICRAAGWNIEFLSGGYESYDLDELACLVRQINKITGQKQWLNCGVLSRDELIRFAPHIKGVCGSVEVLNPKLHKKLCPSKPIGEIEEMFRHAVQLNIDRAMTIVLGLGETIDDLPLLVDFIKKYKINRITLYALNPHEDTIFEKGPSPEYCAGWIARTRLAFPELEIIAGSWVDRLSEINLFLTAGANAITKFPSIKLFNSKFAKQIGDEVKKAGRRFKGTMTDIEKVKIEQLIKRLPFDPELNKRIENKVRQYYKQMSR